MKKEYQSEIMEAIHEEAEALFEAGTIDEKRKAEYDKACLVSKQKLTVKSVNPVAPEKGTKQVTPVYAKPR